MLLCKTVNYFVSVNMLMFSAVAESKRFESIAPMADGSVETVDVVGFGFILFCSCVVVGSGFTLF